MTDVCSESHEGLRLGNKNITFKHSNNDLGVQHRFKVIIEI